MKVREGNQFLWSSKERICLHLLQQKNTRSSLLQIHAFMLRNSIQTNVNLLAKFISTCSSIFSTTNPIYARQVFDERPEKDDTFLCNTMMKIHLGMRQFAECLNLYRDLSRRGTRFTPDGYTFMILAKLCGSSLDSWTSQGVHSHVVKEGFGCSLFVSTAMVDMYAKLGEMASSRKVFDEMPERSQVSWTALVGGYAKCGEMYNARELFNRMPEKDAAAYNAMIDAYVKAGDMASARSLFDEMLEPNVISWTTMVDGYCGNGDLDLARSMFDSMPEKNLVSWNAMISGYSQNKQPHEALKLFHVLQMDKSIEPDDVTIVSILPAIADLGAMELGSWVHQFVKRKKMDKMTNVSTALVAMYAKCGEIAKARKVFQGMPRKTTISWNALINGLAVNGSGKEALDTFLDMKNQGYKPNEITMLAVLSACNHSGLVEEGKRWFKAMPEFKLVPGIEHYGCMIDLLGRAGCLEEAEKMMENMPYETNEIMLSSFLFACWYAKDVTRAERILKKSPQKSAWNDGNYIVLRNLYANEKRWGNVEEIKMLMRRNGAKKEAGCSCIEVDSRVWEFVAGDNVHPQLEGMDSIKPGNLTGRVGSRRVLAGWRVKAGLPATTRLNSRVKRVGSNGTGNGL